MSSRIAGSRFVALYVLPVLALAALLWAWCNPRADAQVNNNNNNGFFNRQVGGVSISADGVVSRSTPADIKSVRPLCPDAKVPAALAKSAEMRMVSLKGLEAACRESLTNKTPFPEELFYLSGMQ